MIEITTFRLLDDANADVFVAYDQELQTVFYLQPGVQRRTTARAADGGWVTITVWDSTTDADAANTTVVTSADLNGWVDSKSVDTRRYETL
jgi:hypothetical protein